MDKSVFIALGVVIFTAVIVITVNGSKRVAPVSATPATPQPTTASATSTPGTWRRWGDNALISGDWSAKAAKKNEMDGVYTQFIEAGGSGVNLVMCFESGKPCKVSTYVSVPGRYCTIEGNVEDRE